MHANAGAQLSAHVCSKATPKVPNLRGLMSVACHCRPTTADATGRFSWRASENPASGTVATRFPPAPGGPADRALGGLSPRAPLPKPRISVWNRSPSRGPLSPLVRSWPSFLSTPWLSDSFETAGRTCQGREMDAVCADGCTVRCVWDTSANTVDANWKPDVLEHRREARCSLCRGAQLGPQHAHQRLPFQKLRAR